LLANILLLREYDEFLEQFVLRGKAASDILERLAEGLLLVNTLEGGGIFGDFFLLDYLKCDELMNKYGGLTTEAIAKQKDVKRARAIEESRKRHLKQNLKIIWNAHVD
jgi:hypothetical protein